MIRFDLSECCFFIIWNEKVTLIHWSLVTGFRICVNLLFIRRQNKATPALFVLSPSRCIQKFIPPIIFRMRIRITLVILFQFVLFYIIHWKNEEIVLSKVNKWWRILTNPRCYLTRYYTNLPRIKITFSSIFLRRIKKVFTGFLISLLRIGILKLYLYICVEKTYNYINRYAICLCDIDGRLWGYNILGGSQSIHIWIWHWFIVFKMNDAG